MRDLTPRPGFFTNFLGLRTQTSLFPHAAPFDGQVIGGLPRPSDQVYGGEIEYAALLSAIEDGDGETFTAIELGAAWGPWVSAAGVVCRRSGYKAINLIAVEACRIKVQTLRDHFAANDLDVLEPTIIHGAAWKENGTLRFPSALAVDDYGARAEEHEGIDYRGHALATEAVPAFSLQAICGNHQRIDYIHWDIQGAEYDVAASAVDLMQERVARVCIGTHSRKIEGDLFQLFHGMGWDLLWERPCGFTYDATKPTLEGMTHSDGEQVWANPHLL